MPVFRTRVRSHCCAAAVRWHYYTLNIEAALKKRLKQQPFQGGLMFSTSVASCGNSSNKAINKVKVGINSIAKALRLNFRCMNQTSITIAVISRNSPPHRVPGTRLNYLNEENGTLPVHLPAH